MHVVYEKQRWLLSPYYMVRQHKSALLTMATVWTHVLGHLGSRVSVSTFRENKRRFVLTLISGYTYTLPLLLMGRDAARRLLFLNVV